jgi:translocation and assembly module TamB
MSRPVPKAVVRICTALIVLVFAGLAILITTLILVDTDWFKDKVRARIVAEVEKSTGGRVEIGSFKLHNLTAELSPFVVHGSEPEGAPPLFRAARVEVGVKIVSVLKQQVDIASLTVDKPEIHVYVNADGSTNLPTPKAARGGIVGNVLDLKIQHFTMTNGFAEYNSNRIPLDLRADNLNANVRYLPSPARYTAEFSSHQFHITSPELRDAAFDLETRLTLDGSKVEIHSAKLALNRSTIDLSGTLADFSSLRANLDVKSQLHLADFAKSVKLPIENRGDIAFNGKAVVAFDPFTYAFDGRLNGRGLAFVSKDLQLPSFAIVSKMVMNRDGINLPDADLAALDGHFRGRIFITGRERFRVKGVMEGFSVQQLARLQRLPANELNGALSGPIEAEGLFTDRGIQDVKSHAILRISPGQTGVPVDGSVVVDYDERAGIVQLGNWNLLLGTSQLTATGNLGQALEVHLTSRNLNDLILALPLIGEKPPAQIPIKLIHGGTAQFDGTMRGPLNHPTLSGRLELTAFEANEREFTHLTSDLDANPSSLHVRTLTLDGDFLHATARGELALQHWAPQEQSPVQVSIGVHGLDITKLTTGGGKRERPGLSGTLSATAAVTGTYGSPQGTGHVQIDNATAYGEPFTRVIADVIFSRETVEALNGRATAGKAEADFSGVYHYSAADWTSGQLRFKMSTRAFTVAQIENFSKVRQGVDGQIDVQATGTAHFVKGDFQLDDLDGSASVRAAVLDGKPLGNLTATAKTRGQVLDIRADADLRGNPVHGEGEWRLTGDYPGSGRISIPRMTLSTLHDIIRSRALRPLPFGGFLSATANVSGPLRNMAAMRADVTVPELQINSSPDTQPRAGAQAQDLVLHNTSPLQFTITSKEMDIRNAQFTGVDTTLKTSGRVAFAEKGAWNLRVDGSINLAILQLFNPDLLASGIAPLSATIRGSFEQPDVSGRLELKNASLYLGELPNGVERANGTIVFDRNRATIEKLSGESGGGTVVFQAGSFVGFNGSTLIYRAQATADHVRYRSPDGLSITAAANLRLSGTSESSMLSGTVTVMRAALSAQTDVGSLLAATAKPVSVPAAPNAYVRGIQFDVRIDSAQNLEVLTSLTRNIQMEANLRLRGNVEHPILLGNISVTEGEIDFFGNKYNINRGEVSFLNPARIAPVVNMDLETRVRGITIDITFAGSLDKLSFSYRSDPPLESNQIVALLAVGREPVGLGSIAGSQVATNTSYLATGTNQILQQAITAPVSGRLQRFFGVSHIKIDPQLTDITSVPQARLTLEQQISKDITLTYITNLSRTSEQVVRVEWNLSRHWSVVAVRDENGLFGIDFQYRKTFK